MKDQWNLYILCAFIDFSVWGFKLPPNVLDWVFKIPTKIFSIIISGIEGKKKVPTGKLKKKKSKSHKVTENPWICKWHSYVPLTLSKCYVR